MRRKVLGRSVVPLIGLALLLSAATPSPAAAAATYESVAGPRILVHFRAAATDADRAGALRSVGAVVDAELPELGVTRVVVASGGDAARIATELAARPEVASAEPDRILRLDFTPNDPLYRTDPYTGAGEWGLRKVGLDRAWDTAHGSPQVVVAVVDTGVDPDHPDLASALLPGATFLTAPSPGCGLGTRDDNSHGTHIAGIIGAQGNDAIGIAGVAFGVRMLPVKALDCAGSGLLSDVAQAIVWSTDHGARVINTSLGSPGESPTLRTAVQYATSRNVLVVAAAGNCGLPSIRCTQRNELEYPGAYPEVLAVGATASDDSVAPFSTRGPQIALTAPGVGIVSTTPRYPTFQSARGTPMNYATFSGTSQATPFVSGVAALVWSGNLSLTAAQVAARVRATADDLGVPGLDPAYGSGRVNAARAVATASAAAPPPVGGFNATYVTNAVPRAAVAGATYAATVNVTNISAATWDAAGTSPVRLGYHWLDAAGNVANWEGTRTPLVADVPPGGSIGISAAVTAPVARGAYILRFDLIREGVSWFSARGAPGADVPVVVGSGLAATYALSAGTSATITSGVPATLAVTLTNTGALAWRASGPGQTRLSHHWLRGDGTVAVWDGSRAPQFASDVAAGQTVVAQLPLAPPPALGNFVLRLDLVQEGVTWFSSQGVAPADIPFAVTSGYAATYVISSPALRLLPGGRAQLPVTLRNDGIARWTAGGSGLVNLATHLLDGAGRVLVWDGRRTALSADVPPGAAVTSGVIVDAPLAAATYRLQTDLVREGVAWFSALGVRPGEASLVVVDDYRAQLPTGLLSVSRSSPTASVTVTNSGSALWTVSGASPPRLSVHWYDAAGNLLVWDGPRSALPHDVAPGESINVPVALGVPPGSAAAVTIDLVADGVRWFGAGAMRPVRLLP